MTDENEYQHYQYDIERLGVLFGTPMQQRNQEWQRDVSDATMELSGEIIDRCVADRECSLYAARNVLPLFVKARDLLKEQKSVYVPVVRWRISEMARILRLGIQGNHTINSAPWTRNEVS